MTANISFTGDILPSERINSIAKGDYLFCFSKDVKPKNCDYLVGNLETPIAGESLRYTHERYCFNTPEGLLDALKESGFDMLTLANNHCMDRGEEGIVNTLDNCARYGFDTVGIYKSEEDRNKPFIKEINGIRIAFINYTYGTNAFAHHRFLEHPYMVNLLQPEETKLGSIHLLNGYNEIADDLNRIYFDKSEEYEYAKSYLAQLENDIKSAKREADYVIAIIHNGGQYVEDVDPYNIFIAEKIKEFGADIIVGHHQHIIQKSDITDDYTKIFCLGNLFYDNRIDSDDCYFDKPLYNAVFHLSLTKNEQGKIEATQSFSIYTTMTDKRGLPVVINSADVYKIKPESHLKSDILHYANLFAGKEKYYEVKDRYEI